jgi:hypothetical protein
MDNFSPNIIAVSASCDEDYLWVLLRDRRQLAVPLAYFPRLLNGTHADRQNVELWGQGTVLHWPSLDEHISVEGLLLGSFRARQSSS